MKMKFTIECEMAEGWIPAFLGMLKQMQRLSHLGSSRIVAIYSDGDGSFRPEFSWHKNLPDPAKPKKENNDGTLFDNY
jgi:hypothetical protein